MVLAKVVYDITAARNVNTSVEIPKKFGKAYKLGKLEVGPRTFRFFCINSTQNDCLSVETDADEKLEGLFEYSLLPNCRKQLETSVKIEKS